jgi:hypothetical protein
MSTVMQTFNYKITLSIKPNLILHRIEHWFTALSNIYGHQSKNFDGYISMAIKDTTSIIITCCVIEDNQEKFNILKERNRDWPGFRIVCIMDAIKNHAKSLGYSVTETSIELISPKVNY